MRRAGQGLLGLLLLAMASCAAEVPALREPGPLGRPEGAWAQQYHAVPVAGPRLILARLCRPPGDGAAGTQDHKPSGLVCIHHLPILRNWLKIQPLDKKTGIGRTAAPHRLLHTAFRPWPPRHP